MFSGLRKLARATERVLKPESTTYVDPYVKEAFEKTLPPGDWRHLEGWSRSFYTKAGHLQSLLKYDKPLRDAPTEVEWSQTVEESFEYFSKLPKVQALSANTDFDNVPYHEGTSAGYGYNHNPGPYPSHKGPKDGPQHKEAKKRSSKIVYELLRHRAKGTLNEFYDSLPQDSHPDIAFTRTQLAELPDMKVRNVFGECFHYVILEGLFAAPLIAAFMVWNTFYYIGHDPVLGVPHLINSLPDEDVVYMTTDWSGFDASVQLYEIDLAFRLLKSILIFPDVATELAFEYVWRLFRARKIIGPDGFIYLRVGGIPSGSYFTHLIDSIINWIRIRFLLKLNRINHSSIKTHGDDALTVITSNFDETYQLQFDALRFGWRINTNHSAVVDDKTKIEFLGRSAKLGTNTRDVNRALRLMLYPEYPVYDPQISITRMKDIDSDSGGNLPFFPNAYHVLADKYGDRKMVLPKEFRIYSQSEIVTYNVSI
jgi:hypothetical protein